MNLFTVSELKKIRIDKYLTEKLKWSRNKVQQLINQGQVWVNDKKIKSNYLVEVNDVIKVIPKLVNDLKVKPKKLKLDICYEDDYLLVVNKPSGMVVHPSLAHHQDTLANALLYHCQKLSDLKGNVRPGIIHRLDKDTSGLLVVAKDNNTHLALAKQLKTKQLKRIYLALVHGNIHHQRGTIKAPIGRCLTNYKKMMVTDVKSKEAITHFKVLKSFKKATLIECELETGRTHQIRVHLQYIKHPIVNDPLYSDKAVINQYGQLLHAEKLTFIHPQTKEIMTFKAPWPDEFKVLMESFNK